jgi:hypothetical protein
MALTNPIMPRDYFWILDIKSYDPGVAGLSDTHTVGEHNIRFSRQQIAGR